MCNLLEFSCTVVTRCALPRCPPVLLSNILCQCRVWSNKSEYGAKVFAHATKNALGSFLILADLAWQYFYAKFRFSKLVEIMVNGMRVRRVVMWNGYLTSCSWSSKNNFGKIFFFEDCQVRLVETNLQYWTVVHVVLNCGFFIHAAKIWRLILKNRKNTIQQVYML